MVLLQGLNPLLTNHSLSYEHLKTESMNLTTQNLYSTLCFINCTMPYMIFFFFFFFHLIFGYL